MTSRVLTSGERLLAASVFGAAIDYEAVRVHQRRWWPLQPRHITMAPDGHLWFHPQADHYCEDFCAGTPLLLQGHFLHEMTHVWQAQQKGRWYLPLMRHPFCCYDYTLSPGKAFAAYGLEQQAEIVRHGFLLRQGVAIAGKPPLSVYEAVLPFRPL
ncbi:MAG: vgr related protein [Sphingobium sp.]